MSSHRVITAECERALYLYSTDFFPELCRWLERQTPDISDALEIAHESTAYAAREELPLDDKHVKNRVFQKARRLLIDLSRRTKLTAIDFNLSEPVDAKTEGAEKVRLELIDSVRAAISSLSETERDCIHLFHYEGLGTTQIARRLSLSANVVKKSLSRAHAQLRETLSGAVSAVDGEGGRT